MKEWVVLSAYLKENYHKKRKPALLVAKLKNVHFYCSIQTFGPDVHLCWFSTYCHLHILTEKPFKMSTMPRFGTDECLSIFIYHLF